MEQVQSCSVITQPSEIPYLKVVDGQVLWKRREQLLREYRCSLIDFWKLLAQRDVLADSDYKDAWVDEEDVILDRISSLNKQLKSLGANISQFHSDGTTANKTCPLFATSWYPGNFQREPLDFDKVQGRVILNPGSHPVSSKEASEHYYDTYFKNNKTLCIPDLRVFKPPAQRKRSKSSNTRKNVHEGVKATTGQRSKNGNLARSSPGSQETDLPLDDQQLRKLSIGDIGLQDHGGGQTNPREQVDEDGKTANMRSIESSKAKRAIHHIPDGELGDQLKKDIRADRQGKDGNYSVASVLEKWGVEKGEKMMILTEFKHQQQGSGYNGDFDVFAISQRFGFFIFQVKSVKAADDKENTQSKRKNVEKAWTQVLKDVAFLHETNRDLPFSFEIPVHTFVAVPNLTMSDMEKISLCEYHAQFILCGTDLKDSPTFDEWMQRRLNSTCPVMPEEHFRMICSRYMGLVAKVNFPNRAAVIEKTRGLVSVVKHGSIDKLHAILTIDQINTIYDATRLKIITGEFGTGKSLILTIKAERIATENNFVYLVTFAGVGTDVNCYHKTECFSIDQLRELLGPHPQTNLRLCQLSDIIKEYDVCQDNETKDWTTVNPKLLNASLEWLTAKHPGQTVHFLCDEVPCYTFQSCWEVLIDLPKRQQNSCMWFVLATHSYKPTQFVLDEAQWYKRLTDNGYTCASLVSSMRIPRGVYTMVQLIRDNESKDIAAGQRCGHVVTGPKPLVFIQPRCICVARKSPLSCECILKRMRRTFRTIFDVLDPEGTIRNESYSILVGCFVGTIFLQDLCQLLWDTFQGIGKKLMFNLTAAMQSKLPTPCGENFISVYDRYTYIGCENTIIIDVDPYALHQCGVNNQWTYATMSFTRTVSQYVLFTWPKEDAKRMWDSDLDAHDELTDERVGMKQLTEELRDIRYEMTARARLSQGDCLDKLISSNAVIVHPIDPLDNTEK